MIDVTLSEIDLRRLRSGMIDYRKTVKKALPAEISLPKEIDNLIARIDIALNLYNERGADSVPEQR